MAYTKQVWADSPATSSPISAARLTHMEDGIYEAQTQWPERTLTLPYSNGGLGGSVATALSAATAGSFRFVVKLPVTVTQWRIKIRHWDYNQTSKTAGTLKKLIVGTHARATTGTNLETGSFTGNTATTIVSTDQTIPGTSGSWYSSPWVSVANGYSAGDLFTADVEYLVAIGYTLASSTALSTGAGRAWHWTNSTSATDPTIAGSGATQQYTPFDWVIEYQCTTRRKVCLVVGDSISEGISGSNSALSSTPLWRNAFNLWAAKNGRLIVNISLAGIQLTNMATSPASNYVWTRQDLVGYTVDEIVISGGSNDFSPGGRTLAQMQADTLTLVNYMVGTLGMTAAKIYLATILARGTTNDSVRVSFNEWISQIPTFATGVIDWDGALIGTSATALRDQLTPDAIHPSWLGMIVQADQLGMSLP